MNQGMYQKKFWFNRQGLPQSADKPKLEITVLANTQDMLRHCHIALSAAFDTVDHNIMLHRLESSFGISGAVLSWLKSFLQNSMQQILLDESSSLISAVTSGVPPSYVLGPLLFLLYTADIPTIASKHHLNIHFYSDDGQLYFYAEPNLVAFLVGAVSDCIGEIDKWMSSNRLKLNADKTQFIWLGSSFNLEKIDIQSVFVQYCSRRTSTILEYWSTAHCPCGTMCTECVGLRSTSCVRFVQSRNLSRVRLPKPWCMPWLPSYPVDLTIVTACSLESISHYWTSCKPFCVPLLDWFWRNSSSIIYRMTFVTNWTGYRSSRE